MQPKKMQPKKNWTKMLANKSGPRKTCLPTNFVIPTKDLTEKKEKKHCCCNKNVVKNSN